MKKRPINAPDAPQPLGGCAQSMEVVGAARILFISGQVPASFEAQARLCWQNLVAQLHAAAMTLDNLVKVTIFLSDRAYTADYRRVRNEVLDDRIIGLTTIITGVFDEAWLLEIEGIVAAD